MKSIGIASRSVLYGMCLALLPLGSAEAANYRLAIEPSYPPDQAQEVYKPLLDYLSRTTGHRFQLVLARNYHAYWRDLRDNAPVDFAFDEAHFVDYRIQFNGFIPIARTAEPTIYALLAQPEYEGQGIRALIGRPTACMPAPSLGFAMLAEMYEDNPVAQPDIRSEPGSWRDGVQMLFAGEVDGAMVPGHLAEEFYNLPTLARTKPLPGRAFTASPSIPAEDVAAIASALESLHEQPDLYDVLAELGATRFEPATAAEYAGHEKILSGFHGYRRNPNLPVPEPAAEPAAEAAEDDESP
ncbi:PhnD/SsuA/transferrin family substrate-binding protein [Xanthomonadaceae bacterium JHOS43]|nr:PhnD/SsuA/transferrin family substrate-binding protein [Xanthomonadaceae bacterium JHOS43]